MKNNEYSKLCKTIDDTKILAKRFAELAKDGCFVSLYGDIGAGKTAFVRLVAEALGIKEKVTSPSFTILNEYHTGEIPVYHFDLYRLVDVDEFYAIGGEEYLQTGLCIFEWGEMIENFIQDDYTRITFSRDDDADNSDLRKLRIEEIKNEDSCC